LPSAVFWTSGISKDALCIGFINLFASLLLEAILFKRKKIRNFIVSFILLYIVFTIKSYIVLAFLPFFLFFILSFKIYLVENRAKRFIIKAFTFISLFTASGLLLIFYRNELMKNIVDDVLSGAFHLAHGQQAIISANDSSYDLGISISDMESKNITPYILKSIVVALFRPYIWEVHKPIILFSFLESCFFFTFTIYVLVKGYLLKTIQVILKNEFIFFAISFSILLAFFVGLVSANFGTLVRYKTPFISYFLLALFMLKANLTNKQESLSLPDSIL
jgi:hypothetical protein